MTVFFLRLKVLYMNGSENSYFYSGPQVDKAQFDKILGYIDAGKRDGAKLAIGGEKAADKGYFIQVKNSIQN